MANFPELVVLSAVMGLSIYLSLPIVLAKSMASRTITILNSIAIGILIFLLADVFSDASVIIYTNPASPYIASPEYAAAFAIAVVACFVALYLAEHRSKGSTLSPRSMALVVAAAIGFQNLTEGLVFGATWAAGVIGLLTVIFVGFFLQNVTEGFPITAPLLGKDERKIGVLAVLFMVGGLPTVLGGVLGYFYNSPLLDVTFDALAIGAILYCILPMLRASFRPAESPEASLLKQRLTYLGILVGFVIGFLVNAL
jgi:zinc transporter, ZIP family